MKTELITENVAKNLAAIEGVTEEYQQLKTTASALQISYVTAQVMQQLGAFLKTPEMVGFLRSLSDTQHGFAVDSDRYNDDQIRAAAITALMAGATLHNNEFNVIAGKCYLTQAFYSRACLNLPGVTDLEIRPGTAAETEHYLNQNKKPFVKMILTGYATCKVDGHRVTVRFDNDPVRGDNRIVLHAFDSDGALDNALGKVEKRLAQALYKRIRGNTFTEDMDAPPDEARPAIESEKPAADAWLDVHRIELTTKHKASKSAAAALFKLSQGDPDLVALAAFLDDLKQVEEIPQRYKERLQRFADDIRARWEAGTEGGAE